jgi:hypothetical protein
MIREFIETPVFRKCWENAGLSDADLRSLQQFLLMNPDAGVVIQGTSGLRKIRVPASGRGKRGGGRVIYKDFVWAGKIFLFFLLLKNEEEDLSFEQRRLL